jgi:sec-independent protein translocase protein TatA
MLKNGLEPWHLILILVVCLLLFGSQKLPDSARSLGQALRAFKAETRAMSEDDAPAPRPAEVEAAPPAASIATRPTVETSRDAGPSRAADEPTRGLE